MSIKLRIRQLEMCKREMFGDLVVTSQNPAKNSTPPSLPIIEPNMAISRQSSQNEFDAFISKEKDRRRTSDLVDQLLNDIYNNLHADYNSATSSTKKSSMIEIDNFDKKDTQELLSIVSYLKFHIERTGSTLLKRLKRRDALRHQQDAHTDVITSQLLLFQRRTPKNSEDIHFSIQPGPGESGFNQWVAAMKMVAELAGGIPPEFRRRLWLTLADRHLTIKGVNWSTVERNCFSEWSHPTDSELGVQIVKDLHRTGCSLFCGEDGQENQALLKRVLLAYARWNKAVGYCQGFNMLAALILQVTDKCETDALKLMIFLIEGILPDSYFADSLRGLSVDMAVFRELLRTRLPRLSKHLDSLQNAARDGTTSYEPPLTNVFTMQWFLTLFCNCLPQPTVLRVWDLILLEGNEILLRTALAIWQTLEDRIVGVRNADEFYCMMGVLTRELLEFGLIDANTLIKTVVAIGSLNELKSLREHYLYNINPWGTSIPSKIYEKQLRMYPRERLVLDISALKQQYAKLKQRQRQAHIIFSAAISRQPPPSAPVAMNHLLLGKSALVPAKRLGPPKGAIPPARVPPSTLLWKDARQRSTSPANSSSSSDTELCDPSEASTSDEDDHHDAKVVPEDSKITVSAEDNLTEDLMTTIDDNIENFLLDGAKCKTPSPPPIPKEELGEDLVKDLFESDDDSVDFENFLEDRVRCLKTVDSPSALPVLEEIETRYGRRNSERALQIIQENSMILHRIMQCQSRLSPPPDNNPPRDVEVSEMSLVQDKVLDDTIETFDPLSPIHQSCFSPYVWEKSPPRSPLAMVSIVPDGTDPKPSEKSPPSSPLAMVSIVPDGTDPKPSEKSPPSSPLAMVSIVPDGTDPKPSEKSHPSSPLAMVSIVPDGTDPKPSEKSPEYGSRYTSILEKSRDLDEKYNDLILRATVRHFPIKNSSTEIDRTDNGEDFLSLKRDEGASTKETFSLDFGSSSSLSPLSEIKGFTGTLLSPNRTLENSPCLEDRSFSPRRSPKSPNLSDSSLKSPSKVFNPFPVSMSSRQNKEVPLKLGLYKK